MFNPFFGCQKLKVFAPLAGSAVRAPGRGVSWSGEANEAAAYSLLRCAALCGRETTIETFAGQMQLARR